MKTTKQQLLNDIETNLPILNDKILKGIQEYKNYVEGLKYENFEEKKNETEDDAIKRAEGIYDRLDEIIIRNELSNNKALETIEILNEMTELFIGIVNNTNVEKEKLAERNNEIIDIIIDLEQRKTNKLIDQNPKRKNGLKGYFEDKKEEWNEHKNKTKETYQKQVIVPIFKPLVNILDHNEMKQLEEWTGMKIGNVIFDSNVDNWNKNTSVFDQKVLNKSNLIFIIEDDDDDIFGCYINDKIDKYDEWINDSKSFVFSLKSNGRLKGMVKFDIIHPQSQYAFWLYNQSSNYRLFEIGNGEICIYKENYKNQSYCQQSFYYNGIQNALCGKYDFTPKRITVIQLIDIKLQERVVKEDDKLKRKEELKMKEMELKRKIEKREKEQEETSKEVIIEKMKESSDVEIKQTKENTFPTIKVVLVGDNISDKNGLIMRYTTNKYPNGYLPTALDDHLFDVVVEGKKCKIEIWDTAGQEDFDKIRNTFYSRSDVFILCYSICDRNSFENLRSHWLPEINNYCPDVPYILVGTKSESRYDESIDMNDIVSEEEGKEMCLKINAFDFIEVSALNGTNVEEAFEIAMKVGLHIINEPRENVSVKADNKGCLIC